MSDIKIYAEGSAHHKNQIGLNLLKTQGFEVDLNYNSEVKYDQIHIFNGIKKIEGQNCTHIYGPHFYHFDINRYDFSEKEFMNCLSPWLVDLTMSIRQDIRCTALPFPVDVDRFIPREKTGKPVIYFKNRDPQLLARVREYFSNDMILVVYGSYSEGSYLQAISEAPYCIWVGCHESQGFAFQEAMSCDTPIFAIDVKSLRDEWGPTMWKNFLPGHNLQATTASYFDETSGLVSCEENWKEDFEEFRSNLSSYNPREFVLNNLSPKACAKKWRDLC